MKGSYEVVVQNARVQFKFVVSRNLTILRGDSATGKTTLIDMIGEYDEMGKSSGVELRCEKPCRVLSGRAWKAVLQTIQDSIVFIDEGNEFVRTEEFAHEIQKTDNYYVIATRASLFMLPYSVNEVYGIRNTTSKYSPVKRMYSQFFQIYGRITPPNLPEFDAVLVEDSHAGFEFFERICREREIACYSAKGKSNIYSKLLEMDAKCILVVADGAAFGPEMERLLSLQKARNIVLFLPESFEWIILKSGLVSDQEITRALENPSDEIESSEYFSWEQFFTRLLSRKTEGTYLRYSKSKLNPIYLNDRERKAILNAMPEFFEEV